MEIDFNSLVCTSSASCIWPPNWSQFVPDVLVALITGAAVGLALDLVQRRRSRRDQIKDAQRSWDRLQSSLRTFFENTPEDTVDSWVNDKNLDAISGRISGHPIQDWNRLLKDRALAALVRLERNATRLLHQSQLLEESLKRAVISHRPASVPKSNLTERHREAERAVRALTFGLGISAARIRVQESISDDDLLYWAQSVCDDDEVKDVLRQYIEARGSMTKEFHAIAREFAKAGVVRQR